MSIHRIDIVGGIQPDGPTNYLDCCQTCQTATVTFENIHGSDLNITLFDIDAVGSGLSISVTAINGGAVSWPFFIAQGDTFTLDIEFCWDGVTTPLTPWEGKFVTVEHGNDATWSFTMECIDWSTIWTIPNPAFDFTDTPIGSTGSQSLTLSNPTIGPVSISLDFTGCGSPLPIQTPDPFVLAPGGTGDLTLTWTPTDISDALDCFPDYCDNLFKVTGNAIEPDCECLCCENIEIQTDGNYLNPSSGFCGPDLIYFKSSFLDKKTVVFSMKYAVQLVTGWNIQFNPALFGLECISPFDDVNAPLPVGYYIQYLSGAHPDGVAQPMTLNGAGVSANNLKNWEVFFRPTDSLNGRFNIELTFYMIQDFEQFLTSLTFDNGQKLKRNTFSAINDWDNSFPSVYNSVKSLQGAFFVKDPATLVDGEIFKCGTITCSSFTGRFYNKGLFNNPSEFTNPNFTISRNIGTVTNFSTIENTKVQFTINVNPAYGAARPDIVFHLFDVTTFDNSVDFLTATDSSRAFVASLPGTGVVNNHLVRPGQLGSVGPDWMCSLHVGTTVNPSSTYRMAAIVYSSNGEMVNTFLSDPITVTQIPDRDCDCELDFDSRWNQYFQTQTADCIRPVAKERIGHRLLIEGGDFENCLTNWGFTFDSWMDRLLTVTLRIYKRREDFPNPGKTTFFQYEQHQSVASNAFPGGFSNPNDLFVQKIGPNVLETVIADRRVRWENNIFAGGQVLTANTNNYMNRTPAGPLGGIYASTLGITDSWINDDIYFEYTFTFNFSADVNAPLFWNIVKAYRVSAIDFEPINSGYEQRLTDVTFEGQDPTTGLYVPIAAPFCFSNYTTIRLTYQADREGNFLFFIEPEPFGLSVIQENDSIPSFTDQTQLTSPIVLSQDSAFDPVTFTAQVVLDGSAFENKRYLFCGYLSSPEAAAICEYFLSHFKIAGSSLIVFPSPQVGDTMTGTFNNVTAGRTLTIRSSNGDTIYPIPGQTYYFEYSFSVPTTRPLDFRFGTLSTSGPIDVTLPIGSTSGSFTMVWGADTAGFWTMETGAGTDMTGTFAFKLGNQLCP